MVWPPDRLTWIDETNRADHPYLRDADRCVFFAGYFAGKGYQGGGTNQLIFNFKCPLAASGGRLAWKQRAIDAVATGLRSIVPRQAAENATWVPIPPSKQVGDPVYDDRLLRTLTAAFKGYDVDVRTLLRQVASTNPDHASGERLTPDTLYELLQVDHTALAARPFRSMVILFDDVLTTGKHFRCCERRLREVLPPRMPITGVFIARRILPSRAPLRGEILKARPFLTSTSSGSWYAISRALHDLPERRVSLVRL